MLAYYCSKCQRQNQQPVCETCGRALGNTAVRYVWETNRLAISNMNRLGLLLRVSAGAVALTVAVMIAIEYLRPWPGSGFFDFFTRSGVLPAAVLLGAALFLFGVLALFLQGREFVQYMLEPRGVLKRTWIEPTRLTCWSRAIRYDRSAFQVNNEGKPFLLAHEEYLAWADTARYKLSPRASSITLYRPYAFVFMALYLPRSEYDAAAKMVDAKLKNRR